jgi:hypothetical protein
MAVYRRDEPGLKVRAESVHSVPPLLVPRPAPSLMCFVCCAFLVAGCGSGGGATEPTPVVAPQITGQVVGNPSGAPVAGATIQYPGGSTTTGGDGRFAIPSSGAGRVSVSASGHITRETGLASGKEAKIDIIEDRPPFDLQLYRTFLRGALDYGTPITLKVWDTAPRLYVKTVFDDSGASVPDETVELTFRQLPGASIASRPRSAAPRGESAKRAGSLCGGTPGATTRTERTSVELRPGVGRRHMRTSFSLLAALLEAPGANTPTPRPVTTFARSVRCVMS